MNRSIAALLLVSCFATCLAAEPGVALSIQVRDESGGVIPDARIFVVWDPVAPGAQKNAQEPAEIYLKTDGQGWSKTEVKPGFYDVFVTSSYFTPACRKMRLKAGEAAKLEIRLKLDSVVVNEFGDRVEPSPN